MNVGTKIALGALAVGTVAVLAACGVKEQDPDAFALENFEDFDRSPKDNNWTQNETLLQYRPTTRTQEVNTYRVGDYIFGTRQILQTNTTASMERIFAAAKGNDAVLSLQELRQFSLDRFDKDKNGTLGRGERRDFESQFGVATRSNTVLIGSEPFTRYSPRNDYPDNSGGGRPTGPGDDGGYVPPGGSTGSGDDGGYVPPSNGGGNGPGDDGGYSPAPAPAPAPAPPSNSGNSTDNGNPSEDDF